MRFEFIHVEKANYAVAVLCRVMEVARSGFYAFQKRPESARACSDRAMLVQIRKAHAVAGRGTYGSPRVYRELRANGFFIGRNRIARLMALDGIQARYRRRFVVTTVVDPGLPTAPNVLNRQFKPTEPNRFWAADITYIRTFQGWLYLAVVIDLYSRRVVGWATSANMKRDLVLRALTMAVQKRSPEPGLVHHSDRGTQYGSWDYQRALSEQDIVCSMSRRANCWDNAVVESFFGTLKTEMVHRASFISRDAAHSALFDYIETFYNTSRRHSSLGFISPAEYERRSSLRN